MKRLRKQLPPLTALTVFEAASRLLSFTRAADELGVTQAAVSRQIHLLEKDFGFPLFTRLHRKVILTDKGKALSAATGDAFNLIAEAVTHLRKDASTDELTISATVAFSHFWLMPRISEFSRQYPYINLRILSQDNMPNLQLSEVDVAIRFGNGMWPDGHAEVLFEDEVFPVCSPDYAGADGRIKTSADLTSYSLISNETDDPTWTGWNEWLSSFSIVVPKKTLGLRCSFYTEAIYAALNGQGIALGWTHLVKDLLQQGRLVRLTDAAIKPRGAYFVVVPTRQHNNEAASLFVNWLQIAAQKPQAQSL